MKKGLHKNRNRIARTQKKHKNHHSQVPVFAPDSHIL